MLCVAALVSASAADRDLLGRAPNIVFILSDDQRADTIAALGNRHIRTPNLDRLVNNGFTFTHAFTMGSAVPAVCVPSRAMLMTGRSLYRALTPVTSNTIPGRAALWPEEFRKAGYTTAGIGKWHNDRASYARCFSAGGPIFFGGMSDHNKVPVYDYDPGGRYPTNKRRIASVHSSELFANAAVSFIRTQSVTRPFLLYVAFTAPHDPRTPPADFARLYDPDRIPLPKNFRPQHPFDNGEMEVRDEKLLPHPRTKEEVRKEIAAYYAMITHMDHQIGRILTALEAGGKRSNTIIVFAGDNGLALGSHGLLGKQNLYDHSLRVPLVFSGASIPRGRHSDALCYLYDVFPTLCDLAGLGVPPVVEGRSLAPLLRSATAPRRAEIFAAYGEVQRMVRDERWKLIYYPQSDRAQLFDIKNDPGETRDLASGGHRGKISELRARLRALQEYYDDPWLVPVTPSR